MPGLRHEVGQFRDEVMPASVACRNSNDSYPATR